MKKNTNYKIQNGCYNCIHAFECYVYDSGSEFYCNRQQDRPMCASSATMVEFENWLYDNHTDKEINKVRKIWKTWATKHEVSCYGICDNFVQRKDCIQE